MSGAQITMDSLMFNVADTLDLTLYMNAEGKSAEGSTVKKIAVGPWKGKTHVYAQTDVVSNDTVAVLVKIRKSLWAYVVSYKPRVGGVSRLVMIPFDGKKAGAKTGNLKAFCTGDLGKTMAKVSPFIGAAFEHKMSKWSRVDADVLVGEIQQQGAVGDQSGHEAAA